MKRSDYTDYDQLPLFLNAEMAAKLLGISLSSASAVKYPSGYSSPATITPAAVKSAEKKSTASWLIRNIVAPPYPIDFL